MALIRPLYIGSSGWHDSMAQTDSLELGGLKMYGDLDANNQVVKNVPAGTLGHHAVNKSQLDTAVITGAKVKELILHRNQLDDAEGVRAAIALVMQQQPVAGDTITLTDGTTTRTYGATSGGDVQYTIGGTVAITMANLATAILGDASGAWGAIYSANLESIDADGAVIIYEEATSGAVSKAYGTWTTPTDVEVVNFYGETEYTKVALTDLPASSPANTNFGFRRVIASVVAGEVHWAKTDDIAYYWDDDDTTWVTTTGAGSIPDATSASGGGIKGKVTFDSDKGLSVASGVAGIVLTANKGLAFAVAGTLETLPDGTKGMEVGASGLATKIDNATITFNGSGQIQSVGSAEAQRVENTLTANADNIAIADPVYGTSTNNKYGKADAATDAKSYPIAIARTAAPSDNDTFEAVSAGPCAAVLTGATAGTRYFLQSGGGIGTGVPGAGLRVIEIGIAKNATDLFVRIIDHGKKPS
jgi:hypothetical protein